MILIEGAPLSDADAFTVSGSIILREDSGIGIRQVEVRDKFRHPLRSVTFECPATAEVRLERVERERLPLSIEGKTCDGTTSSPDLPVWITNSHDSQPSIPLPGSALLCQDNAGCREAEAMAQRFRNDVLEKCNDVRAIRRGRDAHAAAAAAFLAAFVGVVAAAIAAFSIPIFGSVIGAVLLGIAGFLAYFAVVEGIRARREQQRLEQAEVELSVARGRFTDAADGVNKLCARDCRTVELDQPEC
jgi:hypothetical protein